MAELEKLRRTNREKAWVRQAEKDALRKVMQKAEEQRLATAALRETFAKLPREFTVTTLCQGHSVGGTRAHREQRELCLERLRLRSPPLQRELRAR